MKKFWYVLFLPFGILILWCCGSVSNGKAGLQSAQHQMHASLPGHQSMAVLELFTSQGCSSCPPADRLLGTYASKENVIPLSFHVDYWNRLGWKDPFSAKDYSERQYHYAEALHTNVYTPQLVINGQAEMIGNDPEKIAATIQKVLAQEPETAIVIKKAQVTDSTAGITFTIEGTIANSALRLALVEKKATTRINAGENRGITLDNYNVVRKFSTINKFGSGTNSVEIVLPAVTDVKNASVVLFLQDKTNDKITAADQLGF